MVSLILEHLASAVNKDVMSELANYIPIYLLSIVLTVMIRIQFYFTTLSLNCIFAYITTAGYSRKVNYKEFGSWIWLKVPEFNSVKSRHKLTYRMLKIPIDFKKYLGQA